MHDVILDARMIRHTGIGTYVRGLLSGLRTVKEVPLPDMALAGPTRSLDAGAGLPFYTFQTPIYTLREQTAYRQFTGKARLWHAPHYNVPVFPSPARLVTTIHDVIHWIFRKEFFTHAQALYAGTMLRIAIARSSRIIAVSRQTKRDLMHYFQAPEDKIRVIYEAADPSFAKSGPDEVRRVLRRYNLPQTYFLYVGSIKPHKNVDWLISLFREGRASGKISGDLVLVGRKDRKYPEALRSLGELDSGGGIHLLNGLARSELMALYSGAISLVHPSRYEGFGLTPLEAMACGTPVIALKAGSIPEVTGNAALLVDEGDIAGFLGAMASLEQDRALGQSFSEKGLKHVRTFSWEKTARETLAVYREVLGR